MLSFRPLRFWGYLYQKEMGDQEMKSFRPLRFWGYLYRVNIRILQKY